ncbi:MAG: FapA family protein [Desulfosarcinaceae bacterium]|nr:FapA family protein [Desulfosarcinaceae bacterium]
MGTNTLDQALALFDRRFGLVAVHKGLVPRQTLKRVLREYTARCNAGDPVSVWDLMREEGFVSKSEMDHVLPAVVGRSVPSGTAEVEQERSDSAAAAAVKAPKAMETGVALTVSEDKLTAHIRVKAGGVGGLNLLKLKAHLTDRDVAHGLVGDAEMIAFLEADVPNAELLVAQGSPPIEGQPDELQCHFDTNPHRIGTLLEDGSMDWKDRGEIPQAAEGDLLAEIKPGTPGSPGVDVYGHVVAPDAGKRMRVRAGKGARLDEEGIRIYAARDGQPSLNLNNKIMVLPVLKIRGDVGIETGHVEFDGHVEIPGGVQAGYRVRAESLAAGEIHSDDVIVKGDVIVRGGIYGARIKASGNLKAHHVNRSHLLVQGDIVIKKELVDSHAQAGGRCLLDGGVILASEVSAAKGIASGDVGAESANDSFLQVGKDPWLKEAIAEKRAQLKENDLRAEDLTKRVAALKHQGDSVSTELGEVAQVQDKQMVARREMQEQIKREKRKPTAKEQILIKTLGREMEKIDEKVACLMDEEECIDSDLVTLEAERAACAETAERLQVEIDTLTRAAKANPSHTQIKISGRIYEHTGIRGFHARLTMKETLSRCVISEKLDSDPASSRKWYMAIKPL